MRDRNFFYRAPNGQGLTDGELRHWAPSIFATEPHGSRSERYAMIPTSQVLGGRRDNGFVPVYVQQQNSRNADRKGFAKHLIRLRHRDAMDGHAIAREHRRIGMVFPEVTLLNSHDGSSQYSLRAGLLRLAA